MGEFREILCISRSTSVALTAVFLDTRRTLLPIIRASHRSCANRGRGPVTHNRSSESVVVGRHRKRQNGRLVERARGDQYQRRCAESQKDTAHGSPCYASRPNSVTLTRRHRARRSLPAIAVAICTALFAVHAGTSVAPATALAAQASGAASSDALEVLEVRPNFFMITGAGGNIGVQVGDDGVVVVDAGSVASAPAVVAAIKKITPKPIRYVIDTGPDTDHVGGNDVLSKAGNQFFPGTRAAGARPDAVRSVAAILSAEGVLRHMTVAGDQHRRARSLIPRKSFHYAKKFLYLNGEAIEVLHQPAAHTDSDVFVFFRRSDVVVAGDVLDTRRFPVIDIERGGSIDGVIAALNRLVRSPWRRCPSCRARRARS